MQGSCYQCKNRFCCDALDWNPVTGIRTKPCKDFELDENYKEADA